MSVRQRHWNDIYRAKPDTQVSWFQETPSRSLALIQEAEIPKSAPILDVGGGAARLVDTLMARGFSDLSVLDVSDVALERSRTRLCEQAAQISWINADITEWNPPRRWMIWHDRAMFHFLVTESAQQDYVSALTRATLPGATVIIAGFAPEGPERCSGLNVQRHSAAGLARLLGGNFRFISKSEEIHRTPAGVGQDFLYVCFKRLS
ncbi:MAG TPA: class I SAM-dependent methyltransferase [Rhizomicrobium sp.]|nr:class I SAM-dependent methyltransferase [Rhizomicrobium sp.]